ncbi:MAG: hypothetical protein ACYTBJ_09355 [Planctomycetota bacterium]|jgi:hypothetical protein
MDTGQLRTILWLRWRVSRNQWSRGGLLNIVLTTIAAAALLVLGILSGIAGVLVGFLALADASPLKLLAAWDVFAGLFLFARMISLASEFQRPDTIDISRMLHLPISLKDIFFVNYLASHLTLSIILFLPLMLGLCVGLILGRGGFMIGLAPLVLGFVFMVNAWIYCLRGWLLTLTMNKSKLCVIIVGIAFGFILLAQIPCLIGNIPRDRRLRDSETSQSPPTEVLTPTRPDSPDQKTLPRVILLAHHFVPFLWVGNGAMSLAEGNLWPAVLGTIGGFGIGALGLRPAYRSTLRFYRGQAADKRTAKKAKAETHVAGRSLLEKKLPGGVPEEVAASAFAFFRVLSRASEMKIALVADFIFLLIFGAMMSVRQLVMIDNNCKPFVATGVIVFLFFGMSHLMFNQFGFDRSGFRVLVLLPTPRKYILLGKNFAFLPIAVGIGLILLVFVKIALDISFIVFIAASLQLLAAFLLLSMMGNLFSILVPYHVACGFKLTKISNKTRLFNFISQLLLSIAMAPIFLPAGIGLLLSRVRWLPPSSTNLLLSAVLLGLLLFFYRLSLTPLGNLLQKREKEILQIVTQEVE